MKGIIQMTILEPLVHLYQKLRRCCRHNNIKIFFFCSFVLLTGLGKELFSLSISFFCDSKFLLLTQRHVRWHTNNLANNTRRQQRDSQLKANMGNLDRKEKKKHLTHDTEFAACLIKRLCNYTHQGSALKGPVFLSRPVADYVWFKANISGVRKTSAQSPLKRSSLKTTQDIKR